jgi:hypothetical protein
MIRADGLVPHELDVYAARDIMGLRPCDEWKSINLGSGGGPAMMHTGCGFDPGTCYPRGRPPRYTGDERVAFEIVGKMLEKDFFFTLIVRRHQRFARFENRLEGKAAEVEIEGDRYAMAITDAALRALHSRYPQLASRETR